MQKAEACLQFHLVDLALCPSPFSSVYGRADLGDPSLHNRVREVLKNQVVFVVAV